jgi:hypothetical protein
LLRSANFKISRFHAARFQDFLTLSQEWRAQLSVRQAQDPEPVEGLLSRVLVSRKAAKTQRVHHDGVRQRGDGQCAALAPSFIGEGWMARAPPGRRRTQILKTENLEIDKPKIVPISQFQDFTFSRCPISRFPSLVFYWS